MYLMLFSEVGRCRYRWKWIGMPESCVVAADITLISLPVTNLKLLPVSVRHLEFTSAGSVRHGWKNLRTKIVGISSVASTEPEILLGVIYPLSPLATYVMRDTR